MDDAMMRHQIRILEEVQTSPLRHRISPVVAAGFGVVPIDETNGTLTVATVSGGCEERFAALEDYLGTRVRPEVFHRPLLHVYISKIYETGDRSINFNTFESSDFLREIEANRAVFEEKDHEPIAPENALPADQVAYLDLSFRGHLECLDPGPMATPNFEAGDPERRFRLAHGGDLYVYGGNRVPDDCCLLLSQSRRHTGLNYEHELDETFIRSRELPVNIHPTEVQIVGIGVDGSVDFFVYDRVETVWPGETATWEVSYYFLSYGTRLKRKLLIRVNELRIVPRRAITYRKDEHPWTPADLERWLGFDLDANYELRQL